MATTYVDNIQVTYKCPKCKKQVTVGFNSMNLEFELSFDTQECEMCGSHGYVEVDCRCECGRATTVTLKEK